MRRKNRLPYANANANANDLAKIDYKDKDTPDAEYKYDRLSRRVETKQGKDYVQKLEYDDLGSVIVESVTQAGVETHTLTRSYNDAGKSSGYHWEKGGDIQTVEHIYDVSGRMSGVSDGSLGGTYEYLVNTGQIEHIIYQAQGEQKMRTTKQYDPQGRRILKEVYETEQSKLKGKKAPKWKLIKQHHNPRCGPPNSLIVSDAFWTPSPEG